MPKDPKTIAIDTSALLEKQRELSGSASDVPKTVAIDGEEVARRLEEARREREAAPAAPVVAPAARTPWIWVATALAIGLLVVYFVVG